MNHNDTTNHYIDNKEFFEKISVWKALYDESVVKGDTAPRITEYIGECILKIAQNLSRKSNFAWYPYKEEMISDGIENCMLYCKNFNPEISKNPFSYFTQIIYFAFLRRIEKEKKQTYIKYKLIEAADTDGVIRNKILKVYAAGSKDEIFDPEEALMKHFDLSNADIDKFDKKTSKKYRIAKSHGGTLDSLL